jgi:hypothetical protein
MLNSRLIAVRVPSCVSVIEAGREVYNSSVEVVVGLVLVLSEAGQLASNVDCAVMEWRRRVVVVVLEGVEVDDAGDSRDH